MDYFLNKVAVITGSGRGIGGEIAREFSDKKAKVVLTDIRYENLEDIYNELKRENPNVLTIPADVSKLSDAQQLIDKTLEKFNQIDILVNNAGITRDNLVMRMSEEEWDLVIATNLKGTFNCIKAISRQMMKQRYGRIINISSVVGRMGNAGQTNYAASKAGIIGLTKSVAREFASRNITCNAVAPGFIETRMTAVLDEKVVEALKSQIPLGRLGKVGDVAKLVCFLASDDASYITGQVINVDGGMVMF
jgi:3-oxoacyl-[acyl-carrier protein] reductase